MPGENTFRWILLAGLLIVIPIAAFHRLKARAAGGGERIHRRQEGLFILLTLRPVAAAGMVGLILFMVNPEWMRWSAVPMPPWLRWAGVAAGVCSAALLTWTLRNLGRNLTDTVVTRRNSTLVTTGPYRWVRHPFYVAIAMAVLANALGAANWFIFATGAVLVLLLVVRTDREEANLVARFGEGYRAYMERTGRFVPRLRRRP